MNTPGPLVRVKSVEPLENFRVRVIFQNEVQKEIDLEKFLRGEIFEPIRNNPEMFRAVKVVGGTIGWDNGADIDPDVLYYDLKPAWMEETVNS
ncbi:MAG: DUF2442 domain-containing protein [Anaerolineae bacterium]|nr:DUF2442 domain-containing protein [Anaerolineae bacterium]MBL8106267.1 DUF2442 domain-containing protein [Anaerolineales bacterium]MCC7187296.1 DUF2442 domain-containing protein [Anaerolineales bacterium]